MPRQPWLTMINFFNSRDQNEIKSACIGTTKERTRYGMIVRGEIVVTPIKEKMTKI